MSDNLNTQDLEQITSERDLIIKQIDAVQVEDKDSYETAEAFVKVLNEREKRIKDFFKPMKQEADKAKRAILDREKEALDPIVTAKKTIGVRMSAWYRAEQKKRAEEAKKLQEEAKKAGATEEEVETFITPSAPDVGGQRKVWKWKVDKPMDFVAYAKALIATEIEKGEGPIFDALDKYISGQVRALKGDTNLPGVQVYQDTITAVR